MTKKKIDLEKVTALIWDKFDFYGTPYGACYMRQKSIHGSRPLLINPENTGIAAFKVTKATFTKQQTEIMCEILKEDTLTLGVIRDVYTRIGFHGEAIYVYLGRNRIVKITKKEIKIVKNCPVLFLRPPGMLDLPDPVLDDDCKPRSVFKKFFAITNFDVRIQKLIVAYIMAAFYKEGTKPVLLLEGPHGCAKTSGLEIVTGTLDPHGAQLPSLHRSEENLFIYARNRVFAGFDNVSDFKPNISDALCQIATGGSITKRRNYSDDDEFVIPARALLALNGISTGLKRPDLLDRTIKIELQPLPEGERTSMQKIKQRFIEIHPRVLGWLLRATQYGLQNPTPLPAGIQTGRLVDFAQWTYQWAPALGLNPDKLVAAIYENQRGAQAEAIHADTCADFIFYLLDQNDDFWRGTPTALFEELNEWIDDRLGGRRRKGQFPTAPNTLHDWLKRSAPLLETAGVSYDKSRVNNQRLITIVRTSSAEQH